MPGLCSRAKREALDCTALIQPLARLLEDARYPRRITRSLPTMFRASVAMAAKGWGNQIDAARLHDYPVLAVAANDPAAAGATEAVETAPLELAARRLLRAQSRERLEQVTLDINGLLCQYMVNSRAPPTGLFGKESTIRRSPPPPRLGICWQVCW